MMSGAERILIFPEGIVEGTVLYSIHILSHKSSLIHPIQFVISNKDT
jgi:hypothetical protein